MLKIGDRVPRVCRLLPLLFVAMATNLSAQSNCTAPPSSLVSWWPGEGDGRDVVGSNNGAVIGGVTFGSGEVGQSFIFNGTSSYVEIPDNPSLSFASDFTIEFWYKDNGITIGGYSELFAKRPINGPCNYGISMVGGSPSTLYVYILDPNYGSYQFIGYQGLPPAGGFHHLAATFHQAPSDKVLLSAYIDGQLVQAGTIPGNLARTINNVPLDIGRANANGDYFKGQMDEVSIYNRALSASEIATIFQAGSAGKCLSVPPEVTVQPTSQTAIVGSTVSFSVDAIGAQPLTYQWSKDGTNLQDATNSVLTLANVQLSQSGAYSVNITNAFGFTFSSNAVLTVNPPNTCSPPPSGLVSWWPAEGDARDVAGSNNGSVIAGVTFGSGEVGQSFLFNGTSSYVEIPDSPSLSFASDFTIEFWYKDNGITVGGYSELFAKRPISGPCNYGISMVGGSPSTLYVYYLDPNYSSYQSIAYQGLPPAGGFHHLAATFHQAPSDQVLLSAYIDGQLVQTGTVPGNLARTTNNVPLDIGRANANGDYFKGQMDEISIYNRALSASEIATIYQAGTAGKCMSIPPQVTVQPGSQTAIVGSTVSLFVNAIGARPLTYQWSKDGTNLQDATNSVLTLTNVEISQSGAYSVSITNAFGFAISSNAVLTVNPPNTCSPPPSGLVSWWPAEGDARDVVGSNNGSIMNGVTFDLGEVGRSFVFNGTSSYVEIPDSPSLSFTSDFTIEFWYKDNGITVGGYSELFAKRPISGACNYGISMVGGSPSTLYVYYLDSNYGSYQFISYQGLPPAGGFHHLAATFHQAPSNQILLSAYIDGQLVQAGTVPGNLARTTNNVPVDIGRANANGDYFKGQIDELSIYGRLLSGTEIASIYQAGNAGKCSSPIPASIYQQPANQTNTVGQTATFTVGGAGTWPLSYQWAYNGTSIAGGTNSSLVLTNVQMNQAGLYSVVVTNSYGSATSSNATLAVIFPPATVSISPASGTAGGIVTVPVLLSANGNENALGFSLNFDTNLLSNAGVALGAGASGASLVFNTNQAGEVGVGVALPSGTTFAAGTQEVADISFLSAISQSNFSTTLTFGDQPTKRVLSDVTANTLLVNFVGGQVSLTRSAFEADVAPRPNGDGEVTVADWAQVGRFVAALDSPTNASEFQRADCAPKDTLGDGLLTVSDWVQAGRYAAGLDPLTLAGGPTMALNNVVAKQARPKGLQRIVTVQGPMLVAGQTGTAAINLEAQGDENAVGLSLAFDPTVLTYVGASYGADAANAAGMQINATMAANGQLGIILALPSDVSFSAGTRQIMKIQFKAATAASLTSPVSLTDLPVRREVADTTAMAVAATYVNGTVSVNPLPSLAIGQTSKAINLSWPLWATNYVLQSAIGDKLPTTNWTNAPVTPVITNNSLSVSLPVTEAPHFYRLQHQ